MATTSATCSLTAHCRAHVSETLDFTAAAAFLTVGQSAATILGEQKAFQNFLAAEHGTEATAYNVADTPASLDMRIENLAVRSDAVFQGIVHVGNDANELIPGTAGDDVLDGAGGNDTINAGDGNDVATGGSGNDNVFGEAGNDRLVVGHGSSARDGRDVYDGGTGSDTIDFSALLTAIELELEDGTTRYASDVIRNVENVIATNRSDEIEGNAQANEFYGLDGNDELDGNGGADKLFGGNGADKLAGGSGNDHLDGGAGTDRLDGGLGADTLTGGEGSDRFEYASIAEAGNGATRDVITDFYSGDVMDLRSIDANAQRAGNQAFRFIGTDDFSSQAGELRYVTDGTDLIVEGDVNGDRVADFQLELDNTSQLLQTSDFIL